ncbi:hypothetical protein J5N97_028447 [Dioscorea zingiberensis]|uniref:Glucose-methanol-choline oxidoreductase N-terminal domain-containing protein n=1 Tax=Dioscorea zingiberensis TaxID=325984 RepID=A0A9D5BZ94_9LILI|nr:hypothetical protein J5N97_028447 [Dioscorea zingiberensis]
MSCVESHLVEYWKGKDPLKPKQPISAFFLYSSDRRASLTEEKKNMLEEAASIEKEEEEQKKILKQEALQFPTNLLLMMHPAPYHSLRRCHRWLRLWLWGYRHCPGARAIQGHRPRERPLYGEKQHQSHTRHHNGLTTPDMSVNILTGSTVSGSSGINWSASIRIPNHIIGKWQKKHGLELFGSDAYEKALDIVCKRMGVQPNIEEENLNNVVLRRGCKEGSTVASQP